MPYFKKVKRFCLFVSTARSGHSIMAHLLTAHPKVLISDELAAANLLKDGFSKEQVFALIKYQDFRHQRRSRQKGKYNYKIDGVWQNIYDKYPDTTILPISQIQVYVEMTLILLLLNIPIFIDRSVLYPNINKKGYCDLTY